MATDEQQLRLTESLSRASVVMVIYIPPERWPGQIIYLLERLRLQSEIDAERYEEFLRNLQAAITARLEDGRW